MAVFLRTVALLLAALGRCAQGMRPYELNGGDAREPEQEGLWASTDGRIPIWLWWNYSAGTEPGYIIAAQKALERFAPSDKFTVFKVNNTNVGSLLADWPREAPNVYTQAITDIVRAGLLSKYGGVYLDSDMLVAAPMSDITDNLADHDMVSYQAESQDCAKGVFSCNFMATRPGSELHLAWYEEAKARLSHRCTGPTGWAEGMNTPACCYAEASGEMLEECHVPWGGLGDRIGQDVGMKLLTGNNPNGYKIFCYTAEQDEGFGPCNDCYWTSIPGGHDLVENRCELDDKIDGIRCTDNPYPKFFKRKVYHLFSSLLGWKHIAAKDKSFEELTSGPWVFSDLYRKVMQTHV